MKTCPGARRRSLSPERPIPWAWLPLAALAALSTAGCDGFPATYGDVNVISQLEAADGLDLRAVGELVKQAKDAEDLERRLNQPDGVNNLDLDANGQVDFIHVTEYGDEGARGFSLTVQPEQGETQEVATVEIEKAGDRADVDVRGNEQVYGPQHHYHYGTSLGELLLISYLFRPHPFYLSPFHWGYYPAYYGMGYPRVGGTTYTTRTTTLTKGSSAERVDSARRTTLTSPNQGKSASRGIRTSLRNPSSSQRAFATSNRMPRSTGGFGQRAGARTPSMRTRQPSGGLFGGGSRRMGGGFGSRGFRSRR